MRHPLVLIPFLAFLLAGPGRGTAQESPWSVEGELGASVFFGNTEQSTVTTRASAARADSTYELATQASFNYGESTGSDGDAFVSKRSWELDTSFDYHPYGRVSPFVFGTGTSSLERKIDFRFSGGAGAKLTAIRNDRSQLDFSGAALLEQTYVREEATGPDGTLARWSVRVRGRRSFSEGRVTFSTVNSYRPVFDDIGNFVFESESSFAFTVTDAVTLKFSFIDTFDSEATARGAETNNDGQIFFSVLSTF